MNILKNSGNLTAKDMYALTKGNDVRKMADAKGETLEVTKFIVYEDVDQAGEIMSVMAIETTAGARYATNSRTFIRNFTDILSMYEATGEAIPTRYRIGSGRSKSNREYLTCDIAD